jgi:hypothetical protein
MNTAAIRLSQGEMGQSTFDFSLDIGYSRGSMSTTIRGFKNVDFGPSGVRFPRYNVKLIFALFPLCLLTD